jgi:hypothetical protein
MFLVLVIIGGASELHLAMTELFPTTALANVKCITLETYRRNVNRDVID